MTTYEEVNCAECGDLIATIELRVQSDDSAIERRVFENVTPVKPALDGLTFKCVTCSTAREEDAV